MIHFTSQWSGNCWLTTWNNLFFLWLANLKLNLTIKSHICIIHVIAATLRHRDRFWGLDNGKNKQNCLKNKPNTESDSPAFSLLTFPGFSWSRTTEFSRPWARWQEAPIPLWRRKAWEPWVWILMETGSSCSTCWRSMATTPCWCQSSCAAAERQQMTSFSAFHHCWFLKRSWFALSQLCVLHYWLLGVFRTVWASRNFSGMTFFCCTSLCPPFVHCASSSLQPAGKSNNNSQLSWVMWTVLCDHWGQNSPLKWIFHSTAGTSLLEERTMTWS